MTSKLVDVLNMVTSFLAPAIRLYYSLIDIPPVLLSFSCVKYKPSSLISCTAPLPFSLATNNVALSPRAVAE